MSAPPIQEDTPTCPGMHVLGCGGDWRALGETLFLGPETPLGGGSGHGDTPREMVWWGCKTKYLPIWGGWRAVGVPMPPSTHLVGLSLGHIASLSCTCHDSPPSAPLYIAN